ncbi:MAG: hypothetical protein WC763_04740 [Candidatus Paceibacterota bacterium]|jgi:hypothetical protein
MQQAILQKIKEILQGITAIKEIYDYPLDGNPKKFPAAIFYFDSFDNSFETVRDNFIVLRFKLFLVVNLSGTTEAEVYQSIMPKLMDAVVPAINSAWNMGDVEGQRAWGLLTGGNVTLSVEQQAKQATADLTIQVKLSTSV